MSLLASYLFQQIHKNKSDKWVELSILKDYLIDERHELYKELYKIEDLKIEPHYRNIISCTIETRIKQINDFYKRTQLLIEEIK